MVRNDKSKPTGSSKNRQPVDPPSPALTVALCLVVPASVVTSLKKNYPINAPDIENMIDAASYFLCTEIEDANSKQQLLKFKNGSIGNLGEETAEVYLRIHIADGQEMIGKKVPYILKRNLPSHGQGIVKELTCLENLSGLENFNRV